MSNHLSPLRGLYDHFSNFICPQGISYNPYPRLWVWVVMLTPKFLLSDLWTISEKLAMSKFLWDAFGQKKVCVGGGGIGALWGIEALPRPLLPQKKVNRTLNFQSNEPPLKLIRPLLHKNFISPGA